MKKRNFLVLGMLAMALVLGLAFIGCATGPGSGEPAEISFEGTWEAAGGVAGFIFSGGDNVTFYGIEDGGEPWSSPGTFTYTDTTITLSPPWQTWTMGYTLTATYLELTALPGEDPRGWDKRFYKK